MTEIISMVYNEATKHLRAEAIVSPEVFHRLAWGTARRRFRYRVLIARDPCWKALKRVKKERPVCWACVRALGMTKCSSCRKSCRQSDVLVRASSPAHFREVTLPRRHIFVPGPTVGFSFASIGNILLPSIVTCRGIHSKDATSWFPTCATVMPVLPRSSSIAFQHGKQSSIPRWFNHIGALIFLAQVGHDHLHPKIKTQANRNRPPEHHTPS